MDHLELLKNSNSASLSDEFEKRATGRYYTHTSIALRMYSSLLSDSAFVRSKKIKIIDPFAGDGRLVIWLIDFCNSHNLKKEWDVYLYDVNQKGLDIAQKYLAQFKKTGVDLKYTIQSGDSFKATKLYEDQFDLVITNPPWELLKPDSRELKQLDDNERVEYIESMRDYDAFLAENFPFSQPKSKFAGWGTNLSRVGVELAHKLIRGGGHCCIVLPASFFADEQSAQIRKHIVLNSNIIELAYYPAEAKLFDKADVSSSSLTYRKAKNSTARATITIFDKALNVKSSGKVSFHRNNDDFIIPITLGPDALKTLQKIKNNIPTWNEHEKNNLELWAGREIDETGSKMWLSTEPKGPRFIKGRMVGRFTTTDEVLYINKPNWSVPNSASFERIAWRDISRPSQKRRVIATIIPPGVVAGNSLGIVYYRNGDQVSLRALLGIINSLCFEFQLRIHLATGHISLSSLRKVNIPSQTVTSRLTRLAKLCKENISSSNIHDAKIEALVAREVYGFNKKEFGVILNAFEKLTAKELKDIIFEFDNLEMAEILNTNSIANHLSSKLSELDMRIVHAVPPGGNWKNLPEDIPSKRIAQIRESYALGKGSRSTYYGRLLPNMPSYTINTYFNRPGNGCHIHYSQDRVLSQREAARLQSFPDDFVFSGSQTAVNTQIGNAVPPLLSFQIAQKIEEGIGRKGVFIDLFSGAGGMGLGFKWAGWKPLLANDIESKYLDTYADNVHSNTRQGSISDDEFFGNLIKECKKLKKANKNEQFWILGGPPCQGFSTAGNKRSMSDERNSLFLYYKKLVKEVVPDGFVFENVAGLLSMDHGMVFERVKAEFNTVIENLTGWVLNSQDYAIPQRRKRVILIGSKINNFKIIPPEPKTSNENTDLFSTLKNWVSVEDALSDLPPINQGENGSHLTYISSPRTNYQRLMRGEISPSEYLADFT
jgi:Alw26I/Eco31I/Esp3I family type II restriction m6 adenine DNA methyltransferase